MLSSNREFYDLCRKYKYYYNAYNEVKDLKDVYWSKYIKKAHDEVLTELKKVEDEIIYCVLHEILGDFPHIVFERQFEDVSGVQYWSVPVQTGIKVSVLDNEKFKRILDKYNIKNKKRLNEL